MLLETEILNKYKAGELKGIYATDLCFYMPIRITGTGLTIRRTQTNDGDKYYICDRDKELFLSDEIVKACANIPIIVEHPATQQPDDKTSSMLSFKTIQDNPIIGQTIYAYIVDDEIWAIGRIYDFNLLDRLNKDIHSTSPAVYSGEVNQDNGVVKEIPFIINHIAFVDRGHWDQKSDLAFDSSQVNIQGVTDMEQVKQDSNSETLEQKVEAIEQSEAQEAQHLEQIAQEHKQALSDSNNIDEKSNNNDIIQSIKGDDNMMDDVKVDVKSDVKVDEAKIVDEATETTPAVEVATQATPVVESEPVDVVDDEVKPVVDDDNVEAKTDDDDEVKDEVVTDEDDERSNIIDTMTELSDKLDPEVGFKKVFAKTREKPSSLLRRIIANNKNLIDSKYHTLANYVDNSNYGLAIDAYNNLLDNAQQKHNELAKTKHTKSGAKWERVSDNIFIDRSF